MNCPECGGELRRMRVSGLSVGYCVSCQGLWMSAQPGTIPPDEKEAPEGFDSDRAPLSTDEIERIARMLSERDAQLRAFMDNAPLEMALKDRDERYIAINRYAEQLYGRSNEEVIGKRASDLFGEQAVPIHLSARGALESGEVCSQEVDDGLGGTFLATHFPIRDWEDRIVGVGALAFDITSRKEAEQALATLNAELENRVVERTAALREAQRDLLRSERLAAIGELTATVSHELRNPMATMRSSLFVLKRLVDNGERRAVDALARVERSINRCDKIIDELLDFVRERQLDAQPFDVGDWLLGVVGEYPLPEEVTVDTAGVGAGLMANGDSELLRRALVNVLDNAVHAVTRQQPRTAPHPDPRVVLATRTDNDQIVMTVTDNGVGMTDEVIAGAFQPLFSTKGFGTGLGVPAARQILQQHGGDMAFESKPGTGTTVTLRLPNAAAV
ncbi:MAG: ATP-binding protein [Pseudomonadota bacterium]